MSETRTLRFTIEVAVKTDADIDADGVMDLLMDYLCDAPEGSDLDAVIESVDNIEPERAGASGGR